MEFRKLGRTDLDVSAISLGTEYLIDIPPEQVEAVIHAAIARGINYFDLFFSQPAFRDAMGAAFRGHRDRVLLAAHLGAVVQDGQYARSRDLASCEHFFHDFLTRYDTDYVDVLFLHNSDEQDDYDAIMGPEHLLDMARRFQRQGKARFIGFSGHTVSTSQQAVESGAIDVLMFPLNLAANAVPGRKGLLAACVRQNVGLVAMKPYAGGKLLNGERSVSLETFHVGGDALELQKTATITPAHCLAYVLSQAGVSTVVPGCADVDQLADALAYWTASDADKDFSAVMAAFDQYQEGECVYCNHCLPCPSAINIGHTLRLLDLARHELTDDLRASYAAMPVNASECIECGVCTERCPFGVDVVPAMRQAVEMFA